MEQFVCARRAPCQHCLPSGTDTTRSVEVIRQKRGRIWRTARRAYEIDFMVNESFTQGKDSLLGKRAREEVPSVRTSAVELDLQLVNPGRIMDFLRSMISRILKNFEHIGLDVLRRPYFSISQLTSPRDSMVKV